MDGADGGAGGEVEVDDDCGGEDVPDEVEHFLWSFLGSGFGGLRPPVLFIHCGGFVAWRGVAPRFLLFTPLLCSFSCSFPPVFDRVPDVLADALRELRHVVPT